MQLLHSRSGVACYLKHELLHSGQLLGRPLVASQQRSLLLQQHPAKAISYEGLVSWCKGETAGIWPRTYWYPWGCPRTNLEASLVLKGMHHSCLQAATALPRSKGGPVLACVGRQASKPPISSSVRFLAAG
jgi:hypothetical protein